MRNRITLGSVRYLTGFEHRADNPDGTQTWALILWRLSRWDKWLGLPFVIWILWAEQKGEGDG
jgi:hypothetical protein